MVMRWNDWKTDGAAMFLATTATHGTVAVRAYGEEDTKDRILRHYGAVSLVSNIRSWSPALPHYGVLSPTVVLDIEYTLWGLSRDAPYGGAHQEFLTCAGEP